MALEQGSICSHWNQAQCPVQHHQTMEEARLQHREQATQARSEEDTHGELDELHQEPEDLKRMEPSLPRAKSCSAKREVRAEEPACDYLVEVLP